MAKETLKINDSILQWINARFFDKLGSMEGNFTKWLNGESIPTIKQARKLCDKIHIPFRYILFENPPDEKCDIIEFRTVDSVELINPSRELIDVYDKMSQIQVWMEDYLRMGGETSLSFVGKYANSDLYTVVNAIRTVLNFDIKYFENYQSTRECFNFMRKKCQTAGILVLCSGIVGENNKRKLNVKEFRAFAKINNYAPLIFINCNDSWTGRLFSLFHEIAHVFLGLNDLYNEDYKELSKVKNSEVLCNKIASELIMPTDIYNHMNMSIDEYANYFKCSKYVVVRKMLDYGTISKIEYDDFINQFNKEFENSKTNSKKPGGNFYNNKLFKLDNRFVEALNSSVIFGNTSYVEAYRLTDTTEKTYSNIINKLRLA